MIRFPRRAWQSAVALWVIAAICALLMPDPKPAKAVAIGMPDVRLLLAGRSPGARDDGALYQTKLSFLDRYDPGKHERVLGDGRYHPDGGVGGGGDPVGGVPGGTDGLPTPAASGNGFGGDDDPGGPVASFADGGGSALTAIGGLLAGGNGGGGGNAGGGGGTSGPVPLPEPATWLCMVIGFLAVGTLTRRQSIAALPAVH